MASSILRKAWEGKWAIVTGASAGIGEAIAVQLAEAGVNLFLSARRRQRLETLAARLQAKYSVQTQVIMADLSLPEAPRQIFDATEGAGIRIDLLVNNAGFGEYGEFVHCNLQRQLDMVQVNCSAVVQLTHLFLPCMVGRRQGDLLIVSSTAAYQPVPYLATYAATKAFDRILAESVAEEVARYGVRVSALCPGSTESEFSEVAGARPGKNGMGQSPEQVAKIGLEGLIQGKHWTVPYFGGNFQLFAQRFLPRKTVSRAVEKLFRPDHLSSPK